MTRPGCYCSVSSHRTARCLHCPLETRQRWKSYNKILCFVLPQVRSRLNAKFPAVIGGSPIRLIVRSTCMSTPRTSPTRAGCGAVIRPTPTPAVSGNISRYTARTPLDSWTLTLMTMRAARPHLRPWCPALLPPHPLCQVMWYLIVVSALLMIMIIIITLK